MLFDFIRNKHFKRTIYLLFLVLIVSSLGFKFYKYLSYDKDKSNQINVRKTESVYVAGKDSDEFHRPKCKLAKKISPQNILKFKTWVEAIKSGRKPCKVCNP